MQLPLSFKFEFDFFRRKIQCTKMIPDAMARSAKLN